MPDSGAALPLAADAPAVTAAQWRDAVAAVLAKRRPDSPPSGDEAVAALSRTTYDDITVAPLYTAEDVADLPDPGRPGTAPFVRGARTERSEWDVRVRLDDPDPAVVARTALEELETGATSLWVAIAPGALTVADLPSALEGVYLDLAPIVLDAGPDTVAAVDTLLAVAAERSVARADLTGSAGVDPIGTRARRGAPADLAPLAVLADRLADAPRFGIATVDGTVYHDAGASDAQEIGIATSVAVAYLRALVDAGLSVEQALGRIEFRFAVTDEQFASIAKLRAARRVWSRVAELSGVDLDGSDAAAQRQHAVTSHAMLTRYDPWVNLLRGTIACFAAAVGGADAVTVTPFDAAIGRSDRFARRLARNTQSILHDESSLARVLDPAGGSWYVESLTEAVADAAWTVFTDIERAGGALRRLEDGTVARFVSGVREQRAAAVDRRVDPITGVSEFALVSEVPLVREPRPAPADGGQLEAHRWAEPFEAFRDRAAAGPAHPRVYLATLGPYAAHQARAAFAANLFQAGGIECVSGPVDEFAASGCTVACLCSSDELYAQEGAGAVARLRADGAVGVWTAGRTQLAAVDGALYARGRALEVLEAVFVQLGVPA